MTTIANIPASFITAVRARLSTRDASPTIDDREMPLLAAACQYGIGPDDTACQLIANRAEADHARRVCRVADALSRK